MKVPMPSPNGTNRQRLFVHGQIADIVNAGRATYGLAYDSKFGLAKDQEQLDPDTIKKVLTVLRGKLDNETVSRIGKLLSGEVNGDDPLNAYPPGFQGNKSINAYPPASSKGSISMDRRPSWLRPDNASSEARKRMLANMARIGHV